MIGEIHVNDIGTVFKVTVKDENDEIVDVSAATTRELLFRKPDGTILTKTALLVNTGTDGQIKYTTEDGDLDQHGSWSLQAYIDLGSSELHSDIHKFKVYKNIGC